MTDYNERLDETVERIRRGMQRELGGTSPHLEAGYTRDEAKQANTSLMKELVAEAKPSYKPISKYAASIYNQGFNQAVDEFEQNLLKALEEV